MHFILSSRKSMCFLNLFLSFIVGVAFFSTFPVQAAAQVASNSIYVNPVTGNDSNQGTAASPFRTIQKSLQVVQPGDTIKLADGTYNETLKTVRAGTPSAQIIIEPVDGGHPILDGNGGNMILFIIGHSYYTVRGIEFTKAKVGARIEYATGVVFENNKIHHTGNEGMKLHFLSNGNIIRNNTIWTTGLNGNGEGIYIGTAPEQRSRYLGQPDVCTNNIISGNEMYNVSEGVDIKEDSSFNTVSGNIVHESWDANSGGIDVRGDSNYFYGNLSYNGAGAGFRAGGDITTSPIYGANYHYGKNNVLRNNIVRNNAGNGYKFMYGPQDADTSNTGSGNGGVLYYYASGVTPFVTNSSQSDTTPPVISNISVLGLDANSAVISWQTDEPADSLVDYGLSTTYGSNASNSTLANNHSLTLTGLATATAYHYRVTSRDAAGNAAVSGDFTFTTATPSDTTPPVITSVSVSPSTTSAVITWQTNETSASIIDYGLAATYGSNVSAPTLVNNHSVTLTGLAAATAYHYRVTSRDAAGNAAVSGDFTFTTATPPDTTPPVITGLSASPGTTSAVITWQTNEASTSIIDYGLAATYGSNASNSTLVNNRSLTLMGLAAATAYHYRVTSRDAAGNAAISGDFTFTTVTMPAAPVAPVAAGGGGGGGGFSGGGGGGGGSGGGGTSAPTFAVAGDGLTTSSLIEITRNTAVVQQNARLMSTDGKTSLAIDKGTKMTDSAGKPVTTLSLGSVASPPVPPSDRAIVVALEFGPDGTMFVPFATLAIKFDAKSLPEGVKADELYIAFWDGQQWQALESTVNTATGTVTARVMHFTNFAVMGKKPASASPATPPAPVQTPAPTPISEPSPAPMLTPIPAPAPATIFTPTLAPVPPSVLGLPAPAPSQVVASEPTHAPETVHASESLPETLPQVQGPETQAEEQSKLGQGLIIGLIAAAVVVVAVLFLKRKTI